MAVYGLTIFTGAFLLFQVQPMIGKYILPWFGGTPSVWTTCMLFFQVVLLAGYAYAHLVSTRLKPKWQAVTHLGLTVAAFLCLPAIPSDAWKPAGAGDPTWRIIGLLAATIGLPYLALSATSPLLQHWFARTESEKSPYRLYALSNVGSLLALASYPTLFETQFTRQGQARIWGCGLVVYGVGMGLCAWKVWTRASPGAAQGRSSSNAGALASPLVLEKRPAEGRKAQKGREHTGVGTASVRPSLLKEAKAIEARRGGSIFWVLLPACASALLLATTNKMCQEVAVVPFLWVAPLGLYLLSFIICFDSPRWYRRLPFGMGLSGVMAAVCWALFNWSVVSVPAQMCVYGAVCFIGCMICHGEVYRLKPEPEQLTRFYLLIALGGALGGILVGVVAPVLFDDYYELQWGLAGCGLLFLDLVWGDWRAGRLGGWRWKPAWLPSWGALACGGLGLAWVGMIVAFWVQADQQGLHTVTKTRNFYGVLTVFERAEPGSGLRFAKLVHGRTAHGLQFKDVERAKWPTMYYAEKSGVGLALRQFAPGSRRIGVVGLGVGTLASYGQPGDTLRLYEINPSVIKLAQSEFSYLTNCRARVELVLGDARLSLEKEPPQGFDVLVLDAFSSDAIPVHLLTEEAFRQYERHLKPGGILAVHVSNASLDLEPVVANVAARLGYEATMIDHRPPGEKWWVTRSKWILLAKGETASRLSRSCKDSRPARADLTRVPLWTDDFSSLFQILWRTSAQDFVPNTAELELKSALDLAARGDAAGAIKHYQAALEDEPDLAMALNNLAWILATHPDASLRNGAQAIQYARRACELTNFRATMLVGTLGAAYAEAGQFTEAIATGEKACVLASEVGNNALLQRNRQLLELYREGRPARD